MKTVDVCAAAGISYRQLDYWERSGLIEAGFRSRSAGQRVMDRRSGSLREFDLSEVRVTVAIARLVRVGLDPRTAARIARRSTEGIGLADALTEHLIATP